MTGSTTLQVAVIGSGIAGLACAWRLAGAGHTVTLYEANDYCGGHTHTVDVTVDGKTFAVDTGFLVFNSATYPTLIKLFAELGVPSHASDMSFSVNLPWGDKRLEWCGSSLDAVFAQRANLLRPAFLGMLRDIMRFNRHATELARGLDSHDAPSLGAYLDCEGYSKPFRDWYLLPMAGCIWSCPTEQMLAFPLTTFVNFCHNHGLLQLRDRPQWMTVPGGARQYVEKMLPRIADVRLNTPVRSVFRQQNGNRLEVCVSDDTRCDRYDHVVLATHSDQALALLRDAGTHEQRILAAIPYQKNIAVLHTDASVLPQRKKAWAAWNYQSDGQAEPHVCVHYLLNQLQPLPVQTPVIVSLNPIQALAPKSVLARYDYSHPAFDQRAVDAQNKLPAIQGISNVWFAGAWSGYGFHEDGVKSGFQVADALLKRAGESC